MDLSKLNGRAKAAARRVAESDGALAARELAARHTASLGPRIRELVTMDEDAPITPEALLRRAIAAVHGDDEVELALDDVRHAGKRNERLVAAAGIIGGGPGCVVADLYADAALYCLLDRCFDLGLSDDDVAAHLLVAWNAAPDLIRARAIMAAECPASIADEVRSRFRDVPKFDSKREAVAALWRLRSGIADVPLFDPSSFKDLFFAGHASRGRLEEAAAELGLPADAVARPSRLSFRRG